MRVASILVHRDGRIPCPVHRAVHPCTQLLMYNRDLFDRDMERKANGCLGVVCFVAFVAVIIRLVYLYA